MSPAATWVFRVRAEVIVMTRWAELRFMQVFLHLGKHS